MASVEESISKFSKTAAKFCNHLQSNAAALKESVDRRPIPLDSASTTFLQSVNRRVNAAGVDLNMLESMTFGMVSFEELLGHCNEVLKKNQTDLLALHCHLGSLYPSLDFDEDFDLEDFDLCNYSTASGDLGLEKNDLVEEDPLLDDSLSLKKFGISDASLATIASQDGREFEIDEPDSDPYMESLETIRGETTRYSLSQGKTSFLYVPKEDYESLPKHMKGLAAWEDLSAAVEKMNAYIGRTQQDTFHQEEIELLELGYKARSYLLLLIKMNRVNVETREGVISYRVMQ